MLASTFGQTRSSVLKPDNSHLSDGPLIILSLQLLLMVKTGRKLKLSFQCQKIVHIPVEVPVEQSISSTLEEE